VDPTPGDATFRITWGASMHDRLRNALVRVTLLLCAASLASCGYHGVSVKKGSPISDEAVAQLKIGETSRADVFKLLGPPHSMFEEQASLAEFHAFRFFGPGGPGVAQGETRQLGSLSRDQYALLYRFASASASSAFVVVVGQTNVKIGADELLLLFNRNTNILQELAYRRDAPGR
jgi:hypothetical protein